VSDSESRTISQGLLLARAPCTPANDIRNRKAPAPVKKSAIQRWLGEIWKKRKEEKRREKKRKAERKGGVGV
jgi:hypothetical protein